jgi:hypothetical protein
LFFFERAFSVGEGDSADDGGGLPESNDSIVKIGSTEELSKESGVARPEDDG